tara:strand:- start:277 stop:579 length:303 start_codon:yes stop_codon:yes gene_type:complete
MEYKYGWYAPKYVWECLDAKFEVQNEMHRHMLNDILQKCNTSYGNQDTSHEFESMVTRKYQEFVKNNKRKQIKHVRYVGPIEYIDSVYDVDVFTIDVQNT